jgi:predicted ATPase/DNA-binding SARP family transcriptional activator/DNA-binding CsgD family transcriptional regulator
MVGPRSIGEEEWRLKKAASLLKLLALAPGHRLHREQAMELLWPDLDSKAALNNLHHALHVARRTLEPSVPAGSSAASRYLYVRDEWLILYPEGPLWVDVEAFKVAAAMARHALVEPAPYRTAIDLYAGELLPQDRYEAWVEEQRAELRETHLSLLLELSEACEERGELGGATEALRKVVAEEPTHEEAYVGLMRLYALSGRRREALRQYERLGEALFREFGAEPETAATRLQQEIWAGTFPRGDSPPPDGFAPEEPAGAAGRHNLPLARTSFVGREREALEVKRLLAMTKLLTLTGAGGSGKTRLALKVANDLAGAYPDGAWLIELAALSEGELVPQVVAGALGVREQPHRSLVETLVDTLCARKMLLVLDNCEHLVEAVVDLVDALLGTCPGLRVLATSREPLNVADEVKWVVPSLTVPDSGQRSTAEELEGYESVQLFEERARQRVPFFALTSRNEQAVAQICRRLDGIPLAIELAAARMGVLAVEQLAERLEDPLKLLTSGGRPAEPRHQTLRATLHWSYELLDEVERTMFRQLSVFAGGCTLEAAQEVCAGEGIEQDEVLDLLSELVEKSMVVAEPSPEEEGVLHCKMLEPVRQYGQECLEASGEAERVRERHAEYYLALAEEADAQEPGLTLKVSRPVEWLERMEAEHDNLRAALSWALDREEAGESEELGLRLAVAMWWFWYTHDYQTEGRRYLDRALSARSNPTTTRLRARALIGAGWMALTRADFWTAKALMEEGLALCRELGDKEGIASALTELGWVAVLGQRDDIPIAAVLEELMQLKPQLENRNTLSYLLLLEGAIAAIRGDLERAATLHEESLELFREMRDALGTTMCLNHLGFIALIQADYEGAASLLQEALRRGWELDLKPSIQACIHGLACVAACREQPVRAARLWAAVEGMREAYGVHLTPITRSITNYEGLLTTVRSQLGEEEAFVVAWAEGRAMSLERAIEYALSEEEEREPPPTLVPVPDQHPPADERAQWLTRREQEVALLVGRGLTNRRIASELSISERTVENHVRKILKKLGFASRTRIAAWVTQR